MKLKSVLITGGTIRLGAAIAARLRADGWRVLTSSHRADSGADIIQDLTEDLGPAKLYAKALELLGGNPPDALVNNAALFVGSAEAIRKVNFEAAQKLTMMMAGREIGVGAVVNILDSVILGQLASDPIDSKRLYLDSKRELRAFTLSSAMMFAATLRVNAVAPGPILAPTDVHEQAAPMLLDRRPTPEDVAAAVAYFLSAESTTGAIIPVDAGAHLL